MRDIGDLEAVRLLIEWEIGRTDGSITHPTKIPNPVDPSHPTLARKTYQLAKLVIRLTQKAVKAHHDQIQADLKADGRIVDISSPVQLSNGVVETIKLIESGEPALREFEETILSLGERASFDGHPENLSPDARQARHAAECDLCGESAWKSRPEQTRGVCTQAVLRRRLRRAGVAQRLLSGSVETLRI